jgi:hypothetical protein
VSASLELSPVVSESASGAETVTAEAQFFAAINELATGADEIGGRRLWEIIDDTQSANWQNISNPQTAGWTQVTDTQLPNWTVIPTS